MNLELHFADLDAVRRLMALSPRFSAEMRRGLDRAAHELAREARRRVPRGQSILGNSIQPDTLSPLRRAVGAHVQYDRYVQEGTGPAAGKARYFPNVERLKPWIRQRHGLTGEALDDRAWRVARRIYQRGTQPQPYLQQTADAMRQRVETILSESAAEALNNV